MNFIQDLFAGFVPLWNHLMFYGLQATMSEFWVQDDPYDHPNCVLPSEPPCRRVK